MTDIDFSTLPLGRQPARFDARTLHAADYLPPTAVSPPPPAVDWNSRVPHFGMFDNDTLGDCTIAAAAHLTEMWTFDDSGAEVDLPNAAVITAYSAVSGYDPKTGQGDNGAVELDVLNYWRKTGVGGHKLYAFAALDPHNHDQIKQAINIFGGVYIGLNLPLSAQAQTGPGKTWDKAGGSSGQAGSWGGHAIHVSAYDDKSLTGVTWADRQRMTWSFWDAYVEEAYIVLSQDWVGSDNKDPQGFDLTQLSADLTAISKDQPTPSPTPDPVPPTPGPTPTPTGGDLDWCDDPVLADRITTVAANRGKTVRAYQNDHWDRYFGIHSSPSLGQRIKAVFHWPPE